MSRATAHLAGNVLRNEILQIISGEKDQNKEERSGCHQLCIQRNSLREIVAHEEQELFRIILGISSIMGQKDKTNEKNRSIRV